MLACTNATLLMLGRKMWTPLEMMVGKPLGHSCGSSGPDHAMILQDCLVSAHEFARDQLLSSGARQKRNHDVHTKG